ncbi:HET domain containing protein [Naviculisporaceae sp. PSN 640]
MPQCQITRPAPRSHDSSGNQTGWQRVGVGPPHRAANTASPRPRPARCNGKRGRSRESERRHSASPRRSAQGKRRRVERSSDTYRGSSDSRGRSPAAIRQHRPPILSTQPEYKLCQECSEIPWDKAEAVARQDLGFRTYLGRPLCDVGRRFRKLSPDNDCTLCHQLHAPWIEKFFDNTRWMERRIVPDKGDRIHVFPHLQYVPHISNFPSGRKVLRLHDVPFHVAVVPIAPKWKAGMLEHMAKNGMVVVCDDSRPASRILQPQQIPLTFNPKRVRAWLNTCNRGHRRRCNPKPPDPEVKGMRVIDCRSKDLAIRDHHPGDDYVALSYVWGAPNPNGPKPQNSTRSPPKPNTKRILRLPKNVPLTIRDAIQVTKSLGYQYLWVDKYCIDQHNPVEQQEQFSRMGDIYGASQLAIFALGDDSEAGLPGVSSTPRLSQRQCRSGRFRILSTLPDPRESIDFSTWSTRGWTYQEGLFSTRRLFFTNHQVYFECNAMNATECFKSDMTILHTLDKQRLRAYHRAGQFVCGNSTSFSHFDIRRSKGNHRKIDILRQSQRQIATYTRRELTNQNDILHASAAIARFYAKTPARIASLAGLAVPSPIAYRDLPGPGRKQEGLDYLTYALAWTHEVDNFNNNYPRRYSKVNGKQLPWKPVLNPRPQRRQGFPSWSWAGWFGSIRNAGLDHLPYCWTSLLSSVQIGFSDGKLKDFHYIHDGFGPYKTYMIRELLTADTLHFDAYVLNPREVVRRLITTKGNSNSLDRSSDLRWDDNSQDTPLTSSRNTCGDVEVRLSTGPSSLDEFREEMRTSARRQSQIAQVEEENRTCPYYQCVVLGTHGEPRDDVYRAIKAQDPKGPKTRKRRIELFGREEPDRDDIVCLVVRTDPKTGVSYRRGLMMVRYYNGREGLAALRSQFGVGEKKRIVLK